MSRRWYPGAFRRSEGVRDRENCQAELMEVRDVQVLEINVSYS
jgi:hypothetical protein